MGDKKKRKSGKEGMRMKMRVRGGNERRRNRSWFKVWSVALVSTPQGRQELIALRPQQRSAGINEKSEKSLNG